MSDSDNTILSFIDWQFGYDYPNLLAPINLFINAGECVAFVGQNGVGKSSLLKSIMQSIPKTAGSCFFKQHCISSLDTPNIAQLGIAFLGQEKNLFLNLSILDHFKLINKSADQGLTYFPHLIPIQHKKAKQLSGGQKQQLAIAIALNRISNFEQPLLILDEPSANLQPSIIEHILDTLKHIIQQQSITLIIAEQNKVVVDAIAQKQYLIEAGMLINYAEKTD